MAKEITRELIQEQYEKLPESRKNEYHKRIESVIASGLAASQADFLLEISQSSISKLEAVCKAIKLIMVLYVVLACILSAFIKQQWPIQATFILFPVWLAFHLYLKKYYIPKLDEDLRAHRFSCMSLKSVGSYGIGYSLFEKQIELGEKDDEQHYLELKQKILIYLRNLDHNA
jgi:hypothetical protein